MLQQQLDSLKELANSQPALADACRFHADIYQLVAKAEQFIQTDLDETTVAQNLQEGFPILNGSLLQIDPEKAGIFFADLLQILHKHGHQNRKELEILQKAELDLDGLLRASLDRDKQTINQTAEKLSLPPSLLEYCLATTLGAALQRSREQGLAANNDDWRHSYCPICGSMPTIAELQGKEGKKLLHCGLCRNSWTFHRLTCVHCNNSNHTTLAYFTAEGKAGYRVDICRECGGYLKVVDSRELGEGLIMEIEDIATLHLDLLAAKEGFTPGKKEPSQRQQQ